MNKKLKGYVLIVFGFLLFCVSLFFVFDNIIIMVMEDVWSGIGGFLIFGLFVVFGYGFMVDGNKKTKKKS
jgi:hypothetical protein